MRSVTEKTIKQEFEVKDEDVVNDDAYTSGNDQKENVLKGISVEEVYKLQFDCIDEIETFYNMLAKVTDRLLLYSQPSSPPQSVVSPCSHLHSSSFIVGQCSYCSPSYSLIHFLFSPVCVPVLSSPLIILHSWPCSCFSPFYSLTHFLFFPRLICSLLQSSSIAEPGSCSPSCSLSIFLSPPNLLSSPLILHSRVGQLFSPPFAKFPHIFLSSPYLALLQVLVFFTHLHWLLFLGVFSCLRVLLDVFMLLGVFG